MSELQHRARARRRNRLGAGRSVAAWVAGSALLLSLLTAPPVSAASVDETPGPAATQTPGPVATQTPAPSPADTASPTPSEPSSPAPAETATPTATPGPSASATPSPNASPTPIDLPSEVELSGWLLVTAREADAAHPEPVSGHTVILLTEGGTHVELSGDAIEDATTGAQFSGTIVVTDQIADEVAEAVADEPGAPPSTAAELGEAVAEAGADLDMPLQVLTADVTPPTAAVTAARAHTVDVMYISPSASGRPAASAFDAPVQRLSEFWSSQTSGQISKITRNGSVKFATRPANQLCGDKNALWAYAAGPQGFNRKAVYPGDPTSYYWSGKNPVHLLVIVPGSVCGAGNGLGSVGAIHSGGITWSSVDTTKPAGWDNVIFHEVGHNLGLGHSNTNECPRPAVESAGSCTIIEYSDYYDVMGGGYQYGSYSNNANIAALNVTHKKVLDALSGSLTTVTVAKGTEQTFTLQPASAAAGRRGLEIVDPDTAKRYFVEYRSGTGRDAASFYTKISSATDINDKTWMPGVRVLTQHCFSGTSTCAGPESVVLRNWTTGKPQLSYASGDDFTTAKTNAAGSSSVRVSVGALTGTSAVVTVAFDSRLLAMPKPTVTVAGTPGYYRTLTASLSKPWPSGATVKTQWLRDGFPIAGATGATYRVQSADVGTKLTVRSSARLSGYAAASVTSAAVTIPSGWTPLTISGSVKLATGIPTSVREGMTVYALAAGPLPMSATSPVTATVNAATGAYSFAGLAPGRWKVVAIPADGAWDDESGEYLPLDVASGWYGVPATATTEAAAAVLDLEVGRTGVDITLGRSLHISGTVSVPPGSPSSWRGAVRVTAEPVYGSGWFSQRGASARVSPTTGAYTLVGLDASSYRIRFSSEEGDVPLITEYYDGVFRPADATPLTLTADRTGIDASLERLRTVSGSITLPAGAPASWFSYLSVEARTRGGAISYGNVAASGTFTIDRIPPEPVTVCYTVNDLAWDEVAGDVVHLTDLVRQCTGGAAAHERATTVDARPGNVTDVTVTAVRARTISGTVSLPAGVAAKFMNAVSVAAFPLTATGEIDPLLPAASTRLAGPGGAYTLGGLAPGRYAVQFQVESYWWDPDDGTSIPTGLGFVWLGGTPAQTAAATVDLTTGGATGRNVTVPTTGASLKGTIALPSSISADWGGLVLTDRYGTEVARTWIESTAYAFTGLTPGTYRVMLSATADSRPSVQYLRSSTGSWLFTVESNKAVTVALKATATTASISGSLRTTGYGESRSSAVGTLYERDGSTWVAYPGEIAWGSFGDGFAPYTSPALAPGTYAVGFRGEAGSDDPEWWSGRGTLATANAIILGAGAVKTGVNGTVHPIGYIVTDLPLQSTAPVISGTVAVGSRLSVTLGTWTTGAAFTYDWYVGGAVVSHGTTFTPRAVDVGSSIRVAITGSRFGYQTVRRESTLTAPVVRGTLAAPTPTISGTAKVGVALKASAPWTVGAALRYQWAADGKAIAGATKATFTPSTSHLRKKITVTVTGELAGYHTVTKTSAATAPVAPLSKMITATPKITGTAKVGLTLKVAKGTWTSGVTFSYRWYVAGKAVAGATKSSFVPRTGDRGKTVKVTVTARKPGYTTASKTSKSTAKVAAASKLKTAVPKISGTVKVGKTLKLSKGTWTSGTSFSYQWYVGGKAVAGATKSSFVLRVADKGKTVKVKVTGRKAGYVTASRTSISTGRVAG